MLFLLGVAIFLSLLMLIYILFSPIPMAISRNKKNKQIKKVRKYVDKFTVKNKYKYFSKKMRRVVKKSSVADLISIVFSCKSIEQDIDNSLQICGIDRKQFIQDIKLEPKIMNYFYSADDAVVYEVLYLADLLQLDDCKDILVDNFDEYTGQAQFFILYSMMKSKNMDFYNLIKQEKNHKFNADLFNKLETELYLN
ncbi:hypothetical protein [Vagococcus luciliae]|uniref:DUF4240 domain-containing protein n=1 Tax=Vagococcus luciliae TaxID=2920380 RepID=A0ABY5P2K7_9ENTE|nr:hypothetical protein [Vagococcus luciliae]UUV99878.1 hypothetical protein G314FT_20470 [Vagococcus luciliae]